MLCPNVVQRLERDFHRGLAAASAVSNAKCATKTTLAAYQSAVNVMLHGSDTSISVIDSEVAERAIKHSATAVDSNERRHTNGASRAADAVSSSANRVLPEQDAPRKHIHASYARSAVAATTITAAVWAMRTSILVMLSANRDRKRSKLISGI